MRNESDARSRHTSKVLTGRAGRETEDERESRLGRELRHLMKDPRYMEGDPDYRAYVYRQYRRVYDDPSGEPAPLRIGRPQTFTDHIEPFQPGRERRLRLGTEESGASSSKAGRIRRLAKRTILDGVGPSPSKQRQLGSTLAVANRRSGETETSMGSSIFPPDERALINAEETASANRPSPSLAATQRAVSVALERANRIGSEEARESVLVAIRSAKSFIESFDIAGHHTSANFLRHYLLGTGSRVRLPAEFLSEWQPAQKAIGDVDGHFEAWIMGELADSRFGRPILDIQDGERVIAGGDEIGPATSLSDRVNWDATFAGIGDALRGRGNPNHRVRDFIDALGNPDIFDEVMTTFGGATAQGFGYFIFERDGDIVTVRGVVDYRFHDVYKFDWADSYNAGFRLLQRHGIGKEFEIHTTLMRRDFNATIQLENNQPVSITVDQSRLRPL